VIRGPIPLPISLFCCNRPHHCHCASIVIGSDNMRATYAQTASTTYFSSSKYHRACDFFLWLMLIAWRWLRTIANTRTLGASSSYVSGTVFTDGDPEFNCGGGEYISRYDTLLCKLMATSLFSANRSMRC
jgi:hypothetical protein